ncbi:hypothetical protein TEA_008532 [Camellia sinensis var. sinensis]|uniref:Subtilisin-like protease fibronectin type-III domain-containing protein n=1 Tax=Camellia sinensis var. sinensis TaxID=542762 RepID=A0A4S4DS98_CAMSN|nr:hypothetical protein TEA_008532 [Camellia sinensis var. sinensis]
MMKAWVQFHHIGKELASTESTSTTAIGIEIPLFSYVDQRDSIAIGSFHATTKGITVVSSGRNDGPFSQTIVNTAPWLITVAATTTAAGVFVEKANYKGLAWGVARGGAPRAHLAIYKACWAIGTGRCTDADILKAFDKAIEDGVDILSVSIGIEIPLFSYVDRRDSIAIGSFHATTKGITVVSSGGNDGPFSQTIVNTAPWLITVAATTIDRDFPTAITFGNNHTLMGQSLSTGKHKHKHRFTGLVYSERIASDSTDDSAKGCHLGSLNTTLAAGKFVLCFSLPNQQNMVSASRAVKNAGGIGLIYAQFDDNLLDSCDVIPCIRVDYEAGTRILTYIRKTRNPTVKLSFPRTVIGETMSPRVAYFSSRGPSSMSPAVLKPDVAAPGVSILAAYPSIVTKHESGYAFLSGTSMACPHVTGIVALIKSSHPDWSPAAIRSALVTTGTSMACPHVTGIVALIKSAHPDWSPAAIRSALVTTASQKGTDGMDITEMGPTLKKADPFDIGGGHVNPNGAINPGLIYNISKQDYIQFMCAMGYSNISISRLTKTTTNCMKSNHFILNLNLPSITIPNLKRKVTVLRIVSNVGDINSEYKVLVEAPYGVQMVVEPQILHFNSTIRALPFKVTFFSTQKMHGDYRFGSLVWTDGKHFVRSPISIRVIKFDSYADNPFVENFETTYKVKISPTIQYITMDESTTVQSEKLRQFGISSHGHNYQTIIMTKQLRHMRQVEGLLVGAGTSKATCKGINGNSVSFLVPLSEMVDYSDDANSTLISGGRRG